LQTMRRCAPVLQHRMAASSPDLVSRLMGFGCESIPGRVTYPTVDACEETAEALVRMAETKIGQLDSVQIVGYSCSAIELGADNDDG
jgi:hypothetical protein